jgi:hypothetical protein
MSSVQPALRLAQLSWRSYIIETRKGQGAKTENR